MAAITIPVVLAFGTGSTAQKFLVKQNEAVVTAVGTAGGLSIASASDIETIRVFTPIAELVSKQFARRITIEGFKTGVTPKVARRRKLIIAEGTSAAFLTALENGGSGTEIGDGTYTNDETAAKRVDRI